MNHLKLLLCGFAAAAMFSVNVGCQPPAEEDPAVAVDTDTGVPEDTDVTTGTEALDSNVTTGTETPDSNVTTGTETPDSNVTTGTETPGTETP